MSTESKTAAGVQSITQEIARSQGIVAEGLSLNGLYDLVEIILKDGRINQADEPAVVEYVTELFDAHIAPKMRPLVGRITRYGIPHLIGALFDRFAPAA